MLKETDAPSPLLADGLLDQVFSRIRHWFAGLADQLVDTGQALVQPGSLGSWWQAMLDSPAARAHAGSTLAMLAVVLLAALLAELLAVRLLYRPRQRLDRKALLGRVMPQSAAPALRVAPPAAHARAEPRIIMRNFQLFTRLSYALADGVLSLLPLLAFLACSGVLASTLFQPASMAYPVMLVLSHVYVSTRVWLAVVGLIVSPVGQEMRLLPISDKQAKYLWKWAYWILAMSNFGLVFSRIVFLLGVAGPLSVLALKLVSLVVHIMAIIMIVQSRHSVGGGHRGAAQCVGHFVSRHMDRAQAFHRRNMGLYRDFFRCRFMGGMGAGRRRRI